MIRKVLYAKTHNNVNHVVGTGDLGNTFPAPGGGAKSLKNLSMSVSELGLHLRYDLNGLNTETLFPLAAIAIMTLAPENDA